MAKRFPIIPFLGGLIGPRVMSFVSRTLRLHVVGDEGLIELEERHGAICFCSWHALEIVPLFYHRHQNGYTLISEHADGELMARILRGIGYGAVRGSTTHGGVRGLIGLVQVMRKGHSVGVTPDGPHGPRRIVQPGIVFLSQKAKCAIMPMGFASARYWEFRSWDLYRVPKPWSRAELWYDEPILVPPKLAEGEFELWRRRVEDGINRATRNAEIAVGLPPERYYGHEREAQ